MFVLLWIILGLLVLGLIVEKVSLRIFGVGPNGNSLAFNIGFNNIRILLDYEEN
jgi:hypothetical protein